MAMRETIMLYNFSRAYQEKIRIQKETIMLTIFLERTLKQKILGKNDNALLFLQGLPRNRRFQEKIFMFYYFSRVYQEKIRIQKEMIMLYYFFSAYLEIEILGKTFMFYLFSRSLPEKRRIQKETTMLDRIFLGRIRKRLPKRQEQHQNQEYLRSGQKEDSRKVYFTHSY